MQSKNSVADVRRDEWSYSWPWTALSNRGPGSVLSWVSKMRGVTGAEDRGGVTGAEDRGAVGAEGCGVWGGSVPLPTGGGVWRGGYAPSPEFFKNFTSRNGVRWCYIGCYILQFRCLLYTRKPPIYRYVHLDRSRGGCITHSLLPDTTWTYCITICLRKKFWLSQKLGEHE